MTVPERMLQGECSELKMVCNGELAVHEYNTSGPYGLLILVSEAADAVLVDQLHDP